MATDFHIRDEGTIILFWAESLEAQAWWLEHVNDGFDFAGAHVVEHRFASDIITILVDLGFVLKGGR